MTTSPNFDQIIDRFAEPGLKWGRYAGRDILPLWVADMDFAAPQAILERLQQRIAHGIFGYANPWPSLIESVVEAIERDHQWHIDPDWLVWIPGVVTGLNLSCQIAGAPGSEIFTPTPIYPPFLQAPHHSQQRLVTRAMKLKNGQWQWDRPAVESAVGNQTAAFLLCHPHNPVGRIFSEEELRWIADLAERHDFLICSDDIHCGLCFDDETSYRPIAALDPAIARRTITLMAPSKTWNIASLCCAFAVIPDHGLRQRFTRSMQGLITELNVLGLTAAEAAYREGGPWRAALMRYLDANRQQVMQAVENMPGLKTTRPQATYLSWIDCRDTRLEHPAKFFESCGVGLSDGAAFGMPGFVRLNFACPRSRLDDALSRMHQGLESL